MKLIRNHFCADYSSLVLIGAFPNTRAHHNPNITFGFLFYGIEKVIVTPESLEASSMTLWAKLVLPSWVDKVNIEVYGCNYVTATPISFSEGEGFLQCSAE